MRKVVSSLIWAYRGMTAGSGFATTEMRVVMINLVETALRAHPSVVPTIFVDDLAAESMGPNGWITSELGGFITVVVQGFMENCFELSGTKSLVTASTDELGTMMEELWKGGGIFIKYTRKVKALGVGLGAGVRRNVDAMKHRLKTMKKRAPRFRRLRKLGISTSRLLRTGAKAAMTYCQAIMGVSNSLQRDQRRTAAVIAAPESGIGGQDLDLALTLADENAKAGADPAFDAHNMPIGDWATAVWEAWMPERAMERLVAKAKMKLKKTKNTWAKVKGPAAAMVASRQRLGWAVVSSTELRTDRAETLDLCMDSPAAVKLEVARAVKRWRWRNVEAKLPQLRKRRQRHGGPHGTHHQASEVKGQH